MRKKFTLMFVALLTVAAFAATQAVKRAPASLDAPTGTELGAFIKNAVTSNPGVAITVKLAAGGSYTMTTDPGQLPVDAAFTITGDADDPATITWANKPLKGGKGLTIENVIIDATGTTGHIINMQSPTVETWGEGQVSGSDTYWTLDQYKFENVKIKGLVKSVLLDNNMKYYIYTDVVVNNCVIELGTGSKNVTFNFTGGPVKKFTFTNNTVYSADENSSNYAHFFVPGNKRIWKAPGYAATETSSDIFENNTFYNISYGGSKMLINTNVLKGQSNAKFVFKKNIFANTSDPNKLIYKNITNSSAAAKQITAEDNTYVRIAADGTATYWNETALGSDEGLPTGPEFADAANGDFTVGLGSAQLKAGTGDPRWLKDSEGNALVYDETKAPKSDITVSPESGDIAEAVATASEYFSGIDNLTVNLTANAAYTVSAPLVAGGNVTINGNGATIDASGNDGAFILMSKTPAVEANGSSAYIIDNVTIKDVTINNLKGSLFYDNKVKYGVDDFTIDNVVVQLNESAVNYESIIAFEGGGTKAFTIKNSTVYGTGTNVSKFFFRYGGQGRLDRLGYDKNSEIQSWTYTNNTFYNVLKSDGQWGNGQNGQSYMAYYVDNNIWYNCGAANQSIILRLGFGRIATAHTSFTLNTFFNGDADNSAKEASYETDALTTDPGFKDAANGDFTIAYNTEQGKNATGDPRWLGDVEQLKTAIMDELEAEIAAAEAQLQNYASDTEYYLTPAVEAAKQTASEIDFYTSDNIQKAQDALNDLQNVMSGFQWQLTDARQALQNEIDTANDILARYRASANDDYNNEPKVFENAINNAIARLNSSYRYNNYSPTQLWNQVSILQQGENDFKAFLESVGFDLDFNGYTGINGVTTDKNLDGAVIYNLNGQRVEKAQKGLYIINGRKVVIK